MIMGTEGAAVAAGAIEAAARLGFDVDSLRLTGDCDDVAGADGAALSA